VQSGDHRQAKAEKWLKTKAREQKSGNGEDQRNN
jgi:hypothetical protein